MSNIKNPTPTLEEWLRPFNPFLGYTALSLAGDARYIFEAVRAARNCEFDSYYDRQLMRYWPMFSKNHVLLFGHLSGALLSNDDNPADPLIDFHDIYVAAKYGLREVDPGREEILKNYRNVHDRDAFIEQWNLDAEYSRSYFEARNEKYIASLRREDDPGNIRIESLIAKSATAFYVRVYIPCLVETGLPYPIIHRAAQLGNREAMECVLRNNPAALRDKSINENYFRANLENSALYKRYKKAGEDVVRAKVPPVVKIKAFIGIQIRNTFSKFREGMAALQGHFEKCNIRIEPCKKIIVSVKDIFRLFNAMHRHMTGGREIHDPDISSDNTFKISLDRQTGDLKNWRKSLNVSPF